MTKTLNQIIFFFLHQNQNIFFSNIGNQNIFLEKNHNPPPVPYIEFEKLGFLNISNRVKQLRLNHVYNILNNKCPDYMHKIFTKHNLHTSMSTRSQNDIV
jgi:hypothetical protein